MMTLQIARSPKRNRLLLGAFLLLMTSFCASPSQRQKAPVLSKPCAKSPTRVIFFIGDGMGSAQIRATRMFLSADQKPLIFETFPHTAWVATPNVDGDITGSAASSTAMATGRKVKNGVISRAIPGDGSDLVTVLEQYQEAGMATGLVTTDTEVTDATPAAFAAHADERANKEKIISDYFNRSRPNVLMGKPGPEKNVALARAADYHIVSRREGLQKLGSSTPHVFAHFKAGKTPPLGEMVQAALAVVDANDRGFFLLVEHEGTDEYGHKNELAGVVDSVIELEEAVKVALRWVTKHAPDTLVIVGADHETGGLEVTETEPAVGKLPAHRYTTDIHSDALVPFFARGPGAEEFRGTLDNTAIYGLLRSALFQKKETR